MQNMLAEFDLDTNMLHWNKLLIIQKEYYGTNMKPHKDIPCACCSATCRIEQYCTTQ